MGIRYQKRIPLAPGLKLNLNAKSVSLTGGIRGAHVTYNSKGQRTTSVGAPGTGLSYRTTKRVRAGAAPKAFLALVFYLVVGSFIAMVFGLPWWTFGAASLGLGLLLGAIGSLRRR
jgi:hypothetical protein